MLHEQIVDLSRALYADLDTPVSLGVYLRQKYGEWDQFLAMRADPAHYIDTSLGADRYLRDAQAIELLRKYPSLPVRIDRKQVAIDGFYAAEKQCKRTNDFLAPFVDNYGFDATTIRLTPFVEQVKRLVSRILGPLPEDLRVRFGPGATFESKGHRHASCLTAADKMTMPLCCTQGAVDLLSFIYETKWGKAVLKRDHSAPVLVDGNRFTTVPKDATKDRGICIEPGANVALQLAVGRVIRSRLRRFGLDLQNGQDLHRALAQVGSRSGDIATLDLSSASDTVALNLVKVLLPEDWFELLASLRSPKTLIGKRWVVLEKFSSMGNGFTFELETLIFACLTSVASGAQIGSNVFVYGDDILYPSEKAGAVTNCLRLFGFTPNARKSFSSGPFRESCGGDFFAGFPVRPYYIDGEINDPASWISAHNGLRRASLQLGVDRFRRARNRALGNLPRDVRGIRGPVHLGDLVIHDHESRWVTIERSGIRYVKVWRPILKRVKLLNFSPDVQLAVALYGSAYGQMTNMLDIVTKGLTSEGGLKEPVTVVRGAVLVPRNGVCGYRKGWVPFS